MPVRMSHGCIAAWMLVLLVGSGCPHAFGKGGTIDQAWLKDFSANASARGCPKEELQEECGEQGFDGCMKDCQARLKRRSQP
ncbi:hypothetical protein MEBOL_000899 [Melittangium boletus DSM 14713]|uniref:Lipoprotein n=1 Tax=Melittangium boletus DSM 14713 TaxID=1294270 RepID=A0A250I8J3_9BACT|nr:hypothetical protein MEBOL_000899 [Melittangium boletus DSM 14713]